MMKVGITGGIGSGKSTVCRLFAQKGIAVYDSDAAAKRLMQEDGALRRQLAGRFGEGTFRDGSSTGLTSRASSLPTRRRWPTSMHWCIRSLCVISMPGRRGRRVAT